MLLKDMPLRRADYRIVAVASMEQLIGGALSTVIGVMLPMMQLTLHPELPSWLQGILGALGLIGIGIGSMLIGRISDDKGYLLTFRLCPVAIMVGSLICLFFPDLVGLIAGLLIIGIGVGGGYSLDSAYISELLPEKWRLFMVGVAKATCSIGFIGAAVVCALLLHWHPDPKYWNSMILVIFALGLITLLLRIRWAESPKWLLVKGRKAEAQKAAEYF
ncbi:MAG: MFS transporter, partial [Muribaculaceae bacterium]|nr:MFS transporter [Muribaculaceae bacterium]